MHANWTLYKSRREPPELKTESGYISLRQSNDVSLLRNLEQRLLTENPGSVIVPWVAQPFGTIEGYGIYAPEEAKQMRERAKTEFWGSPRPGPSYDLSWIRRRMANLRSQNYVASK